MSRRQLFVIHFLYRRPIHKGSSLCGIAAQKCSGYSFFTKLKSLNLTSLSCRFSANLSKPAAKNLNESMNFKFPILLDIFSFRVWDTTTIGYLSYQDFITFNIQFIVTFLIAAVLVIFGISSWNQLS